MQRLLDDFSNLVDFSLRCGNRTLGDALADLLDQAHADPSVAWQASDIASSISALQRECMHFFYRPHLNDGMDEKLQLAHKLQFNLLPSYCPQRAPVGLATVLESYSHLSGDLLGWRFLADDSFLLWILDISGHGLKAGLLSAVLKTIIDQIVEFEDLESFAARLNTLFVRALKEKDELYYATGVFMRVHRGSLEYISAAHPQVFLRNENGAIEELHSTAIPIGLYPERSFAMKRMPVTPGAMILMYTDGVSEAENTKGEQFGIDRVRKTLEFGYQYTEEAAPGLYRSLSRFQSFDTIGDDVTFLVAKVK